MKPTTTLSILLISIFFLTHFSAFGQEVSYLTFKDSVFLSVDEGNQKIIEHELQPQQTLFSLAKFYGLEMVELMYYNVELKDENNIAIGTSVKVPIPNRAIKRYPTKNFNPKKHASIYYVVQKGDNLYHISKRLFRMPIEDVQERNGLKDFNIQPGQHLHVGWISTEGVPRAYRAGKILPPEWAESQLNGRKYLGAKGIKPEHTQRGVAFWFKNSKNVSDIYALHATAPLNSVIVVTNPMNQRNLYVKVTGRPSQNIYYGNNVIVVLSHKAATMLGARDPRFFVNVGYLK